eukprot:s55_g8.t1
MPFLTQDAAQLVPGAHRLLTTWTEALWGEPIVLLDDSQATLPAEEAPQTNLAQASGDTPLTATVPEPWPDWDEWADLESDEARHHNYRDPAQSSSDGSSLGPVATHRRRRLHAAFDDN